MTDAIDRFIDALLDRGRPVGSNTLAAYRRDLDAVSAQWLAGAAARARRQRSETDLHGLYARHATPTRKATTANRRLTVLQALLPLGAARAPDHGRPDAAAAVGAAVPLRVPKTLTEAQVEALLAAPDVDTPLGLRDRTMLELMYASGLRVQRAGRRSRRCNVEPGRGRAAGRWARAARSALVPFGEEARDWIERYLAEARADDPRRPARATTLVRHRARRGMTRQMFWMIVKKHARAAGITRRCRRTRCGTPSPRTC